MNKMNKKLQRSRYHKIVSGVCGGIGQYFDVDPIVIRFAFIALLLAGGSSLVIYFILLIIMPKEPFLATSSEGHNAPETGSFEDFQQKDLEDTETDNSNRTVFGLLLISGGALLLLNNLVKAFNLEKLWPAILVIIGLGLLFQNKNKDNQNNNI